MPRIFYTKDEYWDSLTEEQKAGYFQTLNKLDDLGLADEIVPVDAVDIWELIPATLRGPKPQLPPEDEEEDYA